MCCIFQRNLYFRELTHDWTDSPEHPKENKIYFCTWDDIACKVHEDSVFFKGIYTPGNSRTTGLVRPSIQKKIRYIYLRTWDDIACKVHEDSVFFKGIYTPGNSRAVWSVRPKIQSEITDICADDIMLVKYMNLLYFSKQSILQGIHARLDWFARTSKRK